MSVMIDVDYDGNLHCALTHGPSKAKLDTDAPLDNRGRGSSFSPTDLVAAALASCALTTMAIKAEDAEISFTKATAKVCKTMTQVAPRRIAALKVDIALPQGCDDKAQDFLQKAACGCPVALSLAAEVDVSFSFSILQ